MRVRFRIFESTFKAWPDLFAEAATSASKIPPDRVINISHSCDKSEGVVTVWYWDGDRETAME